MSETDLTSYKIDDRPKATATRLLREHVRPYLGKLTVAGLVMVVVAGITAAQAYMIEPIVDKIFILKNPSLLFIVAGIVVVLALVGGIASMIQAVMMEGVGHRIVGDLQERLFSHIIRQDIDALNATHTGRLQSLFLFDLGLVKEGVSTAFTGIIKDGLTAMGLIGVMFFQDWRLALGALIALPLAGFPIQRLSKKIRKAATRMQDITGNYATVISEMSTGIRHIKSYGMETRETSRVRVIIDSRVKLIIKAVLARALTTPLTETLGGIAIAIVIIYGGGRVIEGVSTPGQFFSFLIALIMAYRPLKALAKFNSAVQEGISAASRAFSLLDIKPSIQNAADARTLQLNGGNISFRNVQFQYEEGNPVLQGVSLDIEAGKKTALVGKSGSGKSTIINLIARFYDIDSGSLQLDGQEVSSLTLESLRGASAIVTQEAILFDDTIAANIAYGNLEASHDEIEAAAKAADAHTFIISLPNGYDTLVGEAGVRLSGGQRQRLNIARAMIKDAPILLLDEATSSLDSESESEVQKSLDYLTKGRTSVVVAHRLSTIRNADRIYVLDNGVVGESGTHEELINLNGIYASLYSLQEHGFDV
ncbi:MAG: ATP-binding cassette domain-containing protein [Rhodospirillaceae bacterium]|jgi:ATP-binding cassette, subfamily B, bacterial MsbA|nr:ATP-binding cassette domain-containing protein [Rhodospirillaceae bacterium]